MVTLLLNLNTNYHLNLSTYGKMEHPVIYDNEDPSPGKLKCQHQVLTLPLGPASAWKRETQDKRSTSRERRGGASGSCCPESCPHPPCPPYPGARIRPLVEVLFPNIAAVQHKDIEDVDRTDLPLSLPLEGQVLWPTMPTVASTPLQLGKGRAFRTQCISLPPSQLIFRLVWASEQGAIQGNECRASRNLKPSEVGAMLLQPGLTSTQYHLSPLTALSVIPTAIILRAPGKWQIFFPKGFLVGKKNKLN
jgi:hypothetical protein